MNVFIPPFHIGRKQKRAVMDSTGRQLVLFPKGCELMAKEYVEYLNTKHASNTYKHYRTFFEQSIGENEK